MGSSPLHQRRTLVDASGRQFDEFNFKSLRNPEDRPSIFSLLVNANSKLQSAVGPSNPRDLAVYISLVQGVVEEIFYVPGQIQYQPSPLTPPVLLPPSGQDSNNTTSSPQSRGSGGDRQGRDSMDLDRQDSGSVEEVPSNMDTGFEDPSHDREEDDEENDEDDEEDEDPDTINGLTFPEMRIVLQRVSDGTISGKERAEAAMLMLGMAGGEPFRSLPLCPLFLIPDTRSSTSAGGLTADPHVGRTRPTQSGSAVPLENPDREPVSLTWAHARPTTQSPFFPLPTLD